MKRKSRKHMFSSLLTAGLVALGLVSCATGKSPKEDRGRMRVLYGGPNMVYRQQPLILIDGEESTQEHLDKLNTNNIESFNVLKDDSATVVKYGEKARGGVIVVKTKE